MKIYTIILDADKTCTCIMKMQTHLYLLPGNPGYESWFLPRLPTS